MDAPETRYRMVDGDSEQPPAIQEFYVVRKTASGAWIVPRYNYQRMVKPLEARSARELIDDWGAKFVLDGAGRRFAYPSIEMARDSYRIRKQRQIQICEARIRQATAALEWLETGGKPTPSVFPFKLLGEAA